jgi:uncharacterized protein
VVIADRLVLGAPGIYVRSDERIRGLTGVPMDVAAFAGVAPRGPCREPVRDPKRPDAPWAIDPRSGPLRTVATPVESWDAFRRLFGSFDGAALRQLPYAIASFFEQGGRRAYVLRIVHDYADEGANASGVASALLPGVTGAGGSSVRLCARNEGLWGNRLRATFSFRTRPLPFSRATPSELVLDAATPLAPGSLLRLTRQGGSQVLTFVAQVRTVPRADRNATERVVTLDAATGLAPLVAEIVDGILDIEDLATDIRRAERHEGIGLSSHHPTWLASVLADDSTLLRADDSWAGGELLPTDPRLPALTSEGFDGGEDRSADIVPDDFFDRAWVPGNEASGSGVQALADVTDVAMLLTPDLYVPLAPPADEPIGDPLTLAGPEFAECVDIGAPLEQEAGVEELTGLRLDPTIPSDLQRLGDLQQELVQFAEHLKGPVVLLDVPPFLTPRRLRAWRERFDTSYAAAYHPWLHVARLDGRRCTKVRVTPSSLAAGIVARRERLYGVPYGPANELAIGVIDVQAQVSPDVHAELHQVGINVFLRERDGVRLTAARTLSRERSYRQLSVRRLMTMLRRVLEEQLQWMLFEPNTHSLRASVRHMLRGYLGQLYQAGSLAGTTEDEAFFVRCDEALNPPWVVDAGQLIVEVGVAPAEPLEFLVLRFARDGDGTLRVESTRG